MKRAMMRLGHTVVILLPLTVCACEQPDVGAADDIWRPRGINAANLAVMVVDPADLTLGRHDPGPNRKLGAKAVTDLWANPVAPMFSGSSGGGSSSSGSSSGGSPSGGGASGGGGGSGS